MSALLKKPRKWPFSSALVGAEWGWFHRMALGGGILWEGGGRPADVINNVISPVMGAGMTWGSSIYGSALNAGGAGTEYFDIDSPNLARLTIPYTLVWKGVIDDAGTNAFLMQTQDWADRGAVYSGAMIKANTSTGNRSIIAAFGDNTGTGSTDRKTFTWTTAFTHGVETLLAISVTSATAAELFVNGVLQSAPSESGGASSMVSSSINGRFGDSGTAFLGQHSMWAVLNDTITVRQHRQLAEDFSGPFRTGVRPLFISAAAGVGVADYRFRQRFFG